MDAGAYTELFFLDEATALAAGHRPCATCQRDRYDAFMATWSKGNRHGSKTLAGEVEKQLKLDRAPNARAQIASLRDLPDGVMFKHDQSKSYYLLLRNKLYPWNFDGYGKPVSVSSVNGPFTVLTPVSTINALNTGYVAMCHSSAK